ncbi:MAG: hypothetical protein IJ735_02965, partial [Clostridia bacterium]|nr:hypothetical protein [Clostridia bacterium]
DRAQEIIGAVDLEMYTETRETLLSCARFVAAECADRYSDMRKVENVESVEKILPYASFEKPFKKLVSIKQDGKEVVGKLLDSGISVEKDGTYTVEYAYFSERKEQNEELDLPKNFGVDTLAVGVAAEYFFRNGFSDEAILYKGRYDNAVRNDLRTLRAGRLPNRRFV